MFALTPDFCLNLQNGTKLVVPSRLDAITTYVILEQERWFEKEWGFVGRLLEPGMTVLDIGANLGIYSIALARAVGPTGKVYAYEPTSETRARLEQSREINKADNMTVLGSALSDTEREGRIVFGTSSELNRLGASDDGVGEAVHLTSLDLEAQRLGWPPIDFIKMDAEGEELKIIAGGSSVFRDGAPIVMFEIKADTGYEPAIARQFHDMGYGLYRLLPDEAHLVPFVEDEIDGFELNLFAVKSGPASELAARQILAESWDSVAPNGDWSRFIAGQPFAAISSIFTGTLPAGLYGEGLSAYAGWRDASRPIGERVALLRNALERFRLAAAEEASLPKLASLSRAEYDFGNRTKSLEVLRACALALDGGAVPDVPFIPILARFEQLGGDFRTWTISSCIEALQQRGSYSTYYGAALPQLDWVAGTPFATSEIERRRALSAAVRQRPLTLRRDLRLPAPDHLNAEAWVRLMS